MLYRPSRSGTPVATVAPAAILFILKEKVGSDKPASVRFANPSPFRRFLGMNLRSLLEGCDVNNLCFPRILVITRSEEHTSELQSLMRISYAVFCLKKKIYLKRSE